MSYTSQKSSISTEYRWQAVSWNLFMWCTIEHLYRPAIGAWPSNYHSRSAEMVWFDRPHITFLSVVCGNYISVLHCFLDITPILGWLDSLVAKISDWWLSGHKFEPRPPCCRVTTSSKLFTPMCLTNQCNLVLANGQWCSSAGKVTQAWWKVMAAYCRLTACILDQLQAQCSVKSKSSPEAPRNFIAL